MTLFMSEFDCISEFDCGVLFIQTESRSFHLRAGTNSERDVWCYKIARSANVEVTYGY